MSLGKIHVGVSSLSRDVEGCQGQGGAESRNVTGPLNSGVLTNRITIDRSRSRLLDNILIFKYSAGDGDRLPSLLLVK